MGKDKEKYKAFRNSLLTPDFSIIRALFEQPKDKEKQTQPILLLCFDLIKEKKIDDQFFHYCFVKEIRETSEFNTLFRQNSFTTKSVSFYFRNQGKQYAHDVLGAIIKDIVTTAQDVEIYPSKGVNPETAKHNLNYAFRITDELLTRIFVSYDFIPQELKNLLQICAFEVKKRFPNNVLQAIGLIFFLRFIIPHVTLPASFGLCDENQIKPQTRRFLIIWSNILQKLATQNYASEKDSQPGPDELTKKSINAFVKVNTTKLNEFFSKFVSKTFVPKTGNEALEEDDSAVATNNIALIQSYLAKNIDVFMNSCQQFLSLSTQEINDLRNIILLKFVPKQLSPHQPPEQPQIQPLPPLPVTNVRTVRQSRILEEKVVVLDASHRDLVDSLALFEMRTRSFLKISEKRVESLTSENQFLKAELAKLEREKGVVTNVSSETFVVYENLISQLNNIYAFFEIASEENLDEIFQAMWVIQNLYKLTSIPLSPHEPPLTPFTSIKTTSVNTHDTFIKIVPYFLQTMKRIKEIIALISHYSERDEDIRRAMNEEKRLRKINELIVSIRPDLPVFR